MPSFNYICIDSHGGTHQGVVEGESLQHVRLNLSEKGLTPIEITPISEQESDRKSLLTFNSKKTISSSDLTMFTYQLGVLLSAGFPIDLALQNISEQIDNPFFKKIIFNVLASVFEGNTLSSSMDNFPTVFPALYRATIAAGEYAGQLNMVITRLATYLEQQDNIKQKIQQAMIYPALLTTVSLLIIIFLLTYAMPKITAIFTETGQTLPTITLILLSLSNGLKSYGLYILLLFILIYFGIKSLLRLPNIKYKSHVFLLKIPFFGQTITLINASRFLRTLGILFIADVPVLDALQSANNVVTLLPMKKSIFEAIVHVGEGVSINQALLQTGYFTKLSMQLVASGETSGKLEIMLDKAADFQEQHMVKWISTLLSIIEPLMILVMGIFVLFIVLAVLLPIFDMNNFYG